MADKGSKHRNDIYGDNPAGETAGEVAPAIPAATVVLLRDGVDGIETLMLHRTSKVHFGGMWVFPGGRIDPEDYPADGDIEVAARNAAVRETLEETDVTLDNPDFVCFAHWTPPPGTPRRYSTWFFASHFDEEHEVNVDGHEIQNHEWISPAVALERHQNGEIDLAPPTWVTLYHITRRADTASVLEHFSGQPRRVYETRIGQLEDGSRVAMWTGDAGYDGVDALSPGARHRLVMAHGGFVFEHADGEY